MPDAGDVSIATMILWALIGYFSGSVPFGLILAKMGGLGDVRSIGSGNIGATNVLRTGSKKIAIATLLCDILKGAIPVLLAHSIAGEAVAIVAGVAAFLGHVLPVWLKFKGGKGVATYLGVLFALCWPIALLFIAIWIVLALIFRYSSVSSLGASAAMPFAAALIGQSQLIAAAVFVATVIFFAHRGNIGRLLQGEESKIRLRSPASSS